jgi:hypothetical protein
MRVIPNQLLTPSHIMQLQVNAHLTPRPILLTRHGESLHNVRGRVGGDTVLRCFLQVLIKFPVFYVICIYSYWNIMMY